MPSDFDSCLAAACNLGWIVAEQEDTGAAKYFEHACGDQIIAFVVLESKSRICIHRIQARVLQPIGAHFVGKSEAASFLSQVKDNTAATFSQTD